MTRWTLIGLGLAVFLLGLVAGAPASLIDAGLQHASDGRLRLAEARGTLWSGTGQIEIRDRTNRSGVAKPVTWVVRPAYLLIGQLRGEVGLDQATRRFPVTVSLTQVEVADAELDLPASALGLGLPKLAPLGLTGSLLLRVARLSFGRGAVEGSATLQWRGAGSTYTQISPLGDYELRVEGEGTAARGSLRTLQGPLQLEGQGSSKSGANPVFQCTARVAPEYRQQLAPLLRMIALERGERNFELQLN